MRCVAALVFVLACTPYAFATEPNSDQELDVLTWWMTGSFSSEAQARDDSDFLHIVLHMARI